MNEEWMNYLNFVCSISLSLLTFCYEKNRKKKLPIQVQLAWLKMYMPPVVTQHPCALQSTDFTSSSALFLSLSQLFPVHGAILWLSCVAMVTSVQFRVTSLYENDIFPREEILRYSTYRTTKQRTITFFLSLWLNQIWLLKSFWNRCLPGTFPTYNVPI